MLKETTGAFDGARTHDWQVSTDHESDALPTAPPPLHGHGNRIQYKNSIPLNINIYPVFWFHHPIHGLRHWRASYESARHVNQPKDLFLLSVARITSKCWQDSFSDVSSSTLFLVTKLDQGHLYKVIQRSIRMNIHWWLCYEVLK